MDLYPRRYSTFEELYEYCIRVASAVGLMCVEIFGYRDPGCRRYAWSSASRCSSPTSCGTFPVIWRWGGSTSRSRIWTRAGCTRSRPASRRSPTPAAACVRRRSMRCSPRRRRGRATTMLVPARALPRGDRRRMVAAEIMGAIYRGILTRIEAADYDVFSRVIRVPRSQRAMIAARVWLRTLQALLGRMRMQTRDVTVADLAADTRNTRIRTSLSSHPRMFDVAVIGGGVAGLAAATALAEAGRASSCSKPAVSSADARRRSSTASPASGSTTASTCSSAVTARRLRCFGGSAPRRTFACSRR